LEEKEPKRPKPQFQTSTNITYMQA